MYVSEGSKRDISSTNEVADPHDLRRFMKLQKTWPTQADMLLGWMIGAEIESDAGKNVLITLIVHLSLPFFLETKFNVSKIFNVLWGVSCRGLQLMDFSEKFSKN